MCSESTGFYDRQQFVGLPEKVKLPNGQPVNFFGNPVGGVWKGRQDQNMPGRDGYTYGSATVFTVTDVDGVNISGGFKIPGYVCHATGIFRTSSEFGQQLIGQQPEPNRIGLTSAGFPERQVQNRPNSAKLSKGVPQTV